MRYAWPHCIAATLAVAAAVALNSGEVQARGRPDLDARERAARQRRLELQRSIDGALRDLALDLDAAERSAAGSASPVLTAHRGLEAAHRFFATLAARADEAVRTWGADMSSDGASEEGSADLVPSLLTGARGRVGDDFDRSVHDIVARACEKGASLAQKSLESIRPRVVSAGDDESAAYAVHLRGRVPPFADARVELGASSPPAPRILVVAAGGFRRPGAPGAPTAGYGAVWAGGVTDAETRGLEVAVEGLGVHAVIDPAGDGPPAGTVSTAPKRIGPASFVRLSPTTSAWFVCFDTAAYPHGDAGSSGTRLHVGLPQGRNVLVTLSRTVHDAAGVRVGSAVVDRAVVGIPGTSGDGGRSRPSNLRSLVEPAAATDAGALSGAFALPSESAVAATSRAPGGPHRWTFTPATDGLHEFVADGSSDVDLHLFGPTGPLATGDHGLPDGTTRMQAQLTGGSAYSVVVSAGPPGPLDYRLRASLVAKPHRLALGTPTRPGESESITADSFAFDVPTEGAGDHEVRIRGAQGASVSVIAVAADERTESMLATVGSAASDADEVLRVRLAPGAHVVRVSSSKGLPNDYTVAVRRIPPAPPAQIIALGMPSSPAPSAPRTADLFEFAVVDAGVYEVRVAAVPGGSLTVTAAEGGTALGFVVGPYLRLQLAAGTYRAMVESEADLPLSYTIEVLPLVPANLPQAQPISLDVATGPDRTVASVADVFTFAVVAEGGFEIDLTPDPGVSLDASLSVTSADGVTTLAFVAGRAGGVLQLVGLTLPPGSYRIVVASPVAIDPRYDVLVREVP